MSHTSIPLFFNPTAARGRAKSRLPTIEKLLRDNSVEPDTHCSTSMGDLEQQIRAAVDSGVERLIVAGGDGSVHEAVNGIMRADKDAALGIIPIGTGNDFAKAANIPLDWQAATRLLADRITSNSAIRRIDVGRMNDRYFGNGVGIGFDAKVSRIAADLSWPIGDLIYLVAVFRAMADGIITPHMKIVADDYTWDGPLTLANISNGPWVGGMFHIAPMADHADGILDLLIVAPVSGPRILRLLPKLMQGSHMNEPEISRVGVRKLQITVSAPVPSHMDGEIMPLGTSFDIEILPGVLALI
ncbi:MAG: diacylglycerol kinase family lipid kinase [Gammaproteobacteria bacterium]|nr:MAG: diacylglycerol kinase family lipid kinase [Gammaproteobacteria bacterium]